jgi:outer membrane protein OmpA-like peptidoglycan-associated protein
MNDAVAWCLAFDGKLDKMRRIILGVMAITFMAASCKNLNKSQKGAVIGTAGGAAAGAVIGKASGNTALGAIIGATVGGAAGAIIGRQMDKQAEEIEKEVKGVKVERVEEGIVVEFSNQVLFGFDRSDLTSSAQSTLNDLKTVLQKYPDTNIEIQGHTDSKGADSYNLDLSERRATAVAGYLRSVGIASARITTKGYGETAPEYSNATEEGMAQNRRVEFLITANEKMKEEAKKQAGQ